VTAVNPARLPAALRACASGIRPLEAGTGLLIDCGNWLHRKDFTSRFITTGTSISDSDTLLASTDWEGAITALNTRELPSSSGERRMLLLAASLAGGNPGQPLRHPARHRPSQRQPPGESHLPRHRATFQLTSARRPHSKEKGDNACLAVKTIAHITRHADSRNGQTVSNR
jgi:hypothetical protein